MMIFYDRILGKEIEEENLPKNIQLGRFYFLDGNNQGKDLTCKTHKETDKHLYYEEVLNDSFSSKVLRQIDSDAHKSDFISVPFIQGISDCIDPNDFEKKLFKKVEDIRYMCKCPTGKLDREIQKVNIGKAKRISTRGYEYLACHTEDWNFKSIVSFKPNRVLSEFLEENVNIYENRLLVAFVYRVINHLEIRLNELEKIKDFLEEYQKCLSENADKEMHYQKLRRNIKLFVSVYDYKGNKGLLDTSHKLVENTTNSLKRIYLKLKKFTAFPLFNEVKIKKGQVITYHETNILSNDKHYRSLRMLWKELDKISKEKTEDEIIESEQKVVRSIRSYALSLICFTCTNYLGYDKLMGDTYEWVSSHSYLPTISVSMKNDHETIFIKIGNQPELEIIVLGTDKYIDEQILKEHQYVFAYGKFKSSDKIICINVNQVDSTERVGALLRKYVIKVFNRIIEEKYKVNISELEEFKVLLQRKFMSSIINNNYIYIEWPVDIRDNEFFDEFGEIKNKNIREELKTRQRIYNKNNKKSHLPGYKDYIYPLYEKKKTYLHNYIKSINENNKKFREQLICPCCGHPYSFKANREKLNNFVCENSVCNMKLVIAESGLIELTRNDLIQEEGLNYNDYYGMDYITIKL